MPSMNGHVMPSSSPQQSSSATTKRKWAEYNERSEHRGTFSETTNNDRHTTSRDTDNILKDILTVLQRHDTSPSILTSHFNDTLKIDQPQGSSTKQSKASFSAKPNTIMNKFHSGAYTTIGDLKLDVIRVIDEIMKTAGSRSFSCQEDQQRDAFFEHDQLEMNIMAFRKLFNNITRVETQRSLTSTMTNVQAEEQKQEEEEVEEQAEAEDGEEVEKEEDKGEKGKEEVMSRNLNDSNSKEQPVTRDNEDFSGRNVLTLFGTAGGHKQLFSSLQKLAQASNLSNGSHIHPTITDGAVRVPMPLHERGLPLGISRTRIVPVRISDSPNWRNLTSRIADHFPPATNIMQLHPPKTPNSSMTKTSSITWTHREANYEVGRTSGSSTENLTTGLWLGYSGKTPAQEPSSPEAKRKQRDRALSTGEAYPRLSDGAEAAQQQASEDATFRSAYSSFAPSRDDSAAIVPAQMKNQVWWQKIGRDKFETACAVDPVLLGDEPDAQNEDDMSIDRLDEEEAFRRAVDQFDPDELNLHPSLGPALTDPEDVSENLKEISNMLETLHSYQRGRHSSLASNSRGPFAQTNLLQNLMGNPTNPSTAEIEAYRIVQARILRMISQLPPYAVSKLNGQQLADLQISRKIMTEDRDYRGVMEEDQISRMTKAAALTAAAGSGTMGRGTVSSLGSHQATGMQYTPRTANMSQVSRSNGYGQHSYQSQQPFARSTPNYTRNSLSTWQVPTPTTNHAIQRPYGLHTYPQHSPKSVQPPYRQVTGPYVQRAAPGQPLNGPYQQPSPYTPQPHSPYQNRAQTAQMYSPMVQNNSQRSESPQKTLPQSPVAVSTSLAPLSGPSQPILENGPIGYLSQQQHMIDRQRAQLEQQTQARAAVQTSIGQQNHSGSQPLEEVSSPRVNGATSGED